MKLTLTPEKSIEVFHYIKTGLLSLIIFGSSLGLGNTIVDFVEMGDYFSFSLETALAFITFAFFLLVSFALSVGCWNRYDQYLFVLIPMGLGVFFSLEHLDPIQALTFASIFSLIMVLYMYRSLKLKSLLLKFIPGLIFSDATKALMLLFSLLSAFAIFINFENINHPKTLADYIVEAVSTQIQNSSGGPFEILKNANIPLDELIKTNVENFLEPFKQFTMPIIAFLVFSYFQLLGWISYTIYSFLVDPVFWAGKKFNLFKTTEEEVKKENLTF